MNNVVWLRLFLRYSLIGTMNTLVCFCLMAMGDYLGLHYLVFTAVAYGFTIFMSFFLNLLFTFRVSGSVVYRLILFLALNGSNVFLVEGIEYSLIEWTHIHQWLAIITGMIWYVITGFIMNRYIVYRKVA